MKLIDLSVAIEDGLPVDPPPQIAHIDYIDHKAGIESMLQFFPGATQEDLLDGCGWAVDNLKLSTHTGTHLDAPFHYHPTMNHGKPAWTIDRDSSGMVHGRRCNGRFLGQARWICL